MLPHSARHFGRAIIMPNLVPPVLTGDQAAAYRDRILAALLDMEHGLIRKRKQAGSIDGIVRIGCNAKACPQGHLMTPGGQICCCTHPGSDLIGLFFGLPFVKTR